MKKKPEHTAVSLVDDALDECWRDIGALMSEVSRKTSHLERLREHRQSPIMRDDYPAICWTAIAERHVAIAVLTELKRKMGMYLPKPSPKRSTPR